MLLGDGDRQRVRAAGLRGRTLILISSDHGGTKLGHGPDDPLKLIIEVTGEKKKDKAAKGYGQFSWRIGLLTPAKP